MSIETTFETPTLHAELDTALTIVQGNAEWGEIEGDIEDQLDLQEALSGKADTEDIPTKTSDLTNDSGFLTEHQSLAAYRTSAAQDTIDSTKVDKVSGKGLSTNDYTDADKTKVGNAITEHQSLAAYRTSAAQDIIDSGKESAIGSTHHIDGDYVDYDANSTVNDKISVLSTQISGKEAKGKMTISNVEHTVSTQNLVITDGGVTTTYAVLVVS